ncbi:hypothetical protein MUO69_07415 [Candidatus Bathyarchaeota archaeon]|jgi:hypothetical protein|nr:hypothetical protein [Candidatus Bathyarchaeota archaeon]
MDKMIRERHGRFIRFLSDFLLLSACCLFLISMGTPFLRKSEVICVGILGDPSRHCTPKIAYYWSFLASRTMVNRITMFNSYWFSTFNFDRYNLIPRIKVTMLLIAMFLTQILTVVSGLLSLVLKERWARLVPLFSSTVVTLSMVFTNMELFDYYRLEYEIGYWLTYPSMLLFLLAFTTSLIVEKKRKISTAISQLE